MLDIESKRVKVVLVRELVFLFSYFFFFWFCFLTVGVIFFPISAIQPAKKSGFLSPQSSPF